MSSIMRGNLRMAVSGVRGAKWRSLLTMLGVIIGIVSVVTVVGIGEGMKRQIGQQINHLGKDLITIRPGKEASVLDKTKANRDIVFGMQSAGALSTKDWQVVSETSQVKLAVPLGAVSGEVTFEDVQLRSGLVLATSSAMPEVLNHDVAYGEFWQPDEEDTNFVVIGHKVAEQLFDEEAPLGKSLTLRGEKFIVRGVLSPFNALPVSPTANFDSVVFVPVKTAARLTENSLQFYVLLAKPQNAGLDQTVAAIRERLTKAHAGEQDFTVLSPKDDIVASSEILDLLTTWIMAVAVISLLIGGVGIMNIMLVSVSERMHEIGVRKAVGATGRQILGQFIFEAMVLGLIGGLIGIIASLVVSGLLYAYTDFDPVISWEAIAIATVVSLMIGIVFGALPAIQAARKDPIEALRHE